MVTPQVDYAAVYQDIPIPVLLLTAEFVIADANPAYLNATGRTHEAIIGRDLFDAFPDNPLDPSATGVRDIRGSLTRVLVTGRPDYLSVQKYDVEVPGQPGHFAPRYWSAVNAPVFDPDGRIVLIAHCVEEITERVRKFIAGLDKADTRWLNEADLGGSVVGAFPRLATESGR